MTRRVLLDTNLLIAAFDKSGRTSAEMKASAIAMLAELLSDNEVALFITPRFAMKCCVASAGRIKRTLMNFRPP